jgi:hypothetical protein
MVYKVSQSNLDWFANYLVDNKKAF